MVLEYVGKLVPYDDLLRLLGISAIGAPRRNILRLARLGLEITYSESTLALLAGHLDRERPVIAFVDTGELGYWSVASNHAVVVIDMDATHVYVNDPAMMSPALAISRDEFALAWFNCDNACAMITSGKV